MSNFTRRRALGGLGSVGVLALAGCAAPTTDTDPGDDRNGNDIDEPQIETQHVAVDRTGAAWDYRERPGFCAFLADPMDARWVVDEADTAATAFVSDTDFETSVLVYVESVGPNTCYNELALDDVGVENGTIVGHATAIDASDDDVDVCAPSLTYPGSLIRVTTDPLPDAARITITDGWGTVAEVTPEDGVLDPDSLPGSVRPEGEPEVVPDALVCDDDEFERHYPGYGDDVSWGSGTGVDDAPGLELRVVDPDEPAESTTFARGDELRVELTNVSTTPIGIGNDGKYNLELYTEAGWTEVRGHDTDGPPFVYTDELLMHSPGETVSWTLTLTEEGIVERHQHEDRLRVCPDLQPGRYRFVFWDSDDVAVAFDHDG